MCSIQYIFSSEIVFRTGTISKQNIILPTACSSGFFKAFRQSIVDEMHRHYDEKIRTIATKQNAEEIKENRDRCFSLDIKVLIIVF